ncbi:MAG: HAMP domain-containing protein [Alphaproteobacteria bacterium]|nr:HAMP domain-containing protein [Alphaproteobacteria bacterium]
MFKKSIAVRIVSAITLLLVIGMGVLVIAQNTLTNSFFSNEFRRTYEEKTLLLASQMYGGIKWKKEASINEVYAKQADPENDTVLSDVLVTDADRNPLSQFSAEQHDNVDLVAVLGDEFEKLKDEPFVTIDDGVHIITMTAVIDEKKGVVLGYVVMSWSKLHAMNKMASMRNMSIISAGIITLMIAGALVVLLQIMSIRPITSLKETMALLAGGNIDVDIPFTDRVDEIGQMASAVQVFKDNAIEKEKLELEQAEREKRAELEKKESMRLLGDNFKSQVGGLVSSLAAAATELQSTAENMKGIAEQASGYTQTVANTSGEASSNVNAVAAAMEEMTTSNIEITSQINNTLQQSTNAARSADDANVTIANLSELMSTIGDVVGAIRGIADQTNLLALNATIEAARAGEAGKGFAVVADEVKKLANETGEKTDDVEARISQISSAVDSSVLVMGTIIENVSEINNAITIVSSAAEEQNATGKEINRSISEASEGVQNVSMIIGDVQKGMTESQNAADAVLSAANELAQVSEQLSSSVDEFLRQME